MKHNELKVVVLPPVGIGPLDPQPGSDCSASALLG